MKIGYSATFNFPNSVQPFEKHWVEDDELTHGLNLFEEITDEQLAQLTKNIRRIQYVIRSQVKDFAHEVNGLNKKEAQKEVVVNEELKMSQEAKIIAQIYDITDLTVLGSFALLAAKDREKNGEKSNIHAAYQQQLNKLNGLQQSIISGK